MLGGCVGMCIREARAVCPKLDVCRYVIRPKDLECFRYTCHGLRPNTDQVVVKAEKEEKTRKGEYEHKEQLFRAMVGAERVTE